MSCTQTKVIAARTGVGVNGLDDLLLVLCVESGRGLETATVLCLLC